MENNTNTLKRTLLEELNLELSKIKQEDSEAELKRQIEEETEYYPPDYREGYAAFNKVLKDITEEMIMEDAKHFVTSRSRVIDNENEAAYYLNAEEVKFFILKFLQEGGKLKDLHFGAVYAEDTKDFTHIEVTRSKYYNLYPDRFLADKTKKINLLKFLRLDDDTKTYNPSDMKIIEEIRKGYNI